MINVFQYVDDIIKRMFVLLVQERSKIFSKIILAGSCTQKQATWLWYATHFISL